MAVTWLGAARPMPGPASRAPRGSRKHGQSRPPGAPAQPRPTPVLARSRFSVVSSEGPGCVCLTSGPNAALDSARPPAPQATGCCPTERPATAPRRRALASPLPPPQKDSPLGSAPCPQRRRSGRQRPSARAVPWVAAGRSGAFGSGQDQRGSCRAPILPSARISLSTTDRGTTALLSSVAGGTTENKHLAGAPRDALRCDWATVIRARGEAGRGGSGTAGSRVEARRSFSCAFNELSNEVGASSEEGCGLDFYEIIPFLCAFSLWKYSGRSQQS